MIYLDNSATTPILPEVYEAMVPYLTTEYGNPSSKYYPLALSAKQAVETSRQWVARLIGAKPEEIIFTAGATESSNLIIKGTADFQKYYAKKGSHIITSKVEHHATLNTCKFLNGDIYSNDDATFSLTGEPMKVNRGYRVSFLDVNAYGQVRRETFEAEIAEDTVLATFLWGNNEIGSINDMDMLCEVAHRAGVLIHADATQMLGKVAVDLSRTPVDFLSLSAHKLGGPKGIGAAFIRADDYGLPPISALLHGGQQEGGIRAGTHAVHNIVGLGKAAELALQQTSDHAEQQRRQDRAVREYLRAVEHIRVLGDPDNHLPGIFSMVVENDFFNNERFLKKVSGELALSTGSACTAGAPSHVLQAIGLGHETSKVLRVTLDERTGLEDVRVLIGHIERYMQ